VSEAAAAPATSGEKSIAVQASWLLAAKVVGFVFALAIPLVVSRRLSIVEFGLYKQAFLLVSTAGAVLPLGFQMSAFYFLPRQKECRGGVVLNILLYQACVGALGMLALLVWPEILSVLFGDDALKPHAPILGLVLFLWTSSSFVEVIATANQDVVASTAFIVAAQATRAIFAITAATVVPTAHGQIVAAAIQTFLQTLLLLWYLQSRFPGFWSKFEWPLMKAQIAYAAPLGFASLVYIVQTDLHNYVVANTFGAATFAVYAVGVAQLPLVGLIRESVDSVLLPRISYLQEQNQREAILQLTFRASRKLALVYLPMFAFLSVCGYDLLVLMYTGKFSASWPIFAVNLMLLPLGMFINDPVLRAYAAHRYTLLRVRFIVLPVLIAALYFGTPLYGPVYAIGTVVAISLGERVVLGWIVYRRILECRWQDFTIVQPLLRIAAASALAACLALAARLMIPNWHPAFGLAACGLVFLTAYAGFAVALRVPDDGAIRDAFQRLDIFAAVWKQARTKPRP
jgi:O-antigen/teichoic acid export membrane protein